MGVERLGQETGRHIQRRKSAVRGKYVYRGRGRRG